MMHKYRNADDYADQSTETAFGFLKIVGFVILGVLFTFLIGFLFQWLWNTLVTDIFDLRMITYWEGVGLIVLAKIIFGFGGSNDSGPKKRKKHGLVASEIRREIRKDMLKEYAQKFPEEASVETAESIKPEKVEKQDELYDKWWAEEGEKQFESYMNKPNNDA